MKLCVNENAACSHTELKQTPICCANHLTYFPKTLSLCVFSYPHFFSFFFFLTQWVNALIVFQCAANICHRHTIIQIKQGFPAPIRQAFKQRSERRKSSNLDDKYIVCVKGVFIQTTFFPRRLEKKYNNKNNINNYQ